MTFTPSGEYYQDLEDLEKRLRQVPELSAKDLEAEEIAILGRKQGEITVRLRKLADPKLVPVQKAALGSDLNRIKRAFEQAFEQRRHDLKAQADAAATKSLDLTMPGRGRWTGAVHPVSLVIDEIVGIFRELGFAVAVGPEIETEWYNFLALNFPADHPAMDMHDTLYVAAPPVAEEGHAGGKLLLRTHTSPVQIRTLLTAPPPVRVVIPGMVYRKDPFDASHAPAFAQIEGLAVDEGISFVDLKATLAHFARRFFSADTRVRFRPSFFPFTEPSAEMDVSCRLCGGTGCAACKQTGWVEILGCGMVHPSVLADTGVDPERYTGFAFGMGPHRIAMQRYDVPDIRPLYEGDMRFLTQWAP